MGLTIIEPTNTLIDVGGRSKPCTKRKWVWGLPVRCRGTMHRYCLHEGERIVERYVCLNDYTHVEATYGREDEA